MSFLGPATMQPISKDVAKYVGLIRETVKNKSRDQTLSIVTSILHATAHYALHAFGHRETLAMLKEARLSVEETDPSGLVRPWN